MYRLNLQQKVSTSSTKRVGGVYSLQHGGGIILRQSPNLIGFGYNSENKRLEQKWTEKVFNERSDFHEQKYPWFVTNRVLDTDLVVIVHPDGIKFYEANNSTLKFIVEDGNFHVVNQYQKFVIGNFYPKRDQVGVIAKNPGNSTEFYYVTNASLKTDDPLFVLDRTVALNNDWKSADVSLTKMSKNAPDFIVVRTEDGLKFHQFNENDELLTVFETNLIPTQNPLFFANFTGGKYLDILQLNISGLYIHRFDEPMNDYKLLHHDTSFTAPFGWKNEYIDTLKPVDLNGDGINELLFTSSKGLTGLTPITNHETFEWKSIFNTDELGSDMKFGRIIHTWKDSLLVQTLSGDLAVLGFEKEDEQHPTEPTTDVSFTIIPVPNTDANHPEFVSKVLPKQRKELWWGDQYDQSFIKDPVDVSTGHIRFEIPLVNVGAVTGWHIPITLIYSSDHFKSSQYHGNGWGAPMIGLDYITVDHQHSIFPEKAIYYLVTRGQVSQLNRIGGDRFQLKQDTDLNIAYHAVDNTWVIENEIEKVIYGRKTDSTGQTFGAIQQTLAWPNWCGIGRDATTTKHETIGWSLMKRIDKVKARELFYVYDVDSVSAVVGGARAYTTAIRLTKITNRNDFHLTFKYEKKLHGEYVKRDFVDKDGNIAFPVPLLQSHYMTEYSLVTPTYEQTLKFEYIIEHNQRFLSQIIQQKNVLMQFKYENGRLTRFNILPFQLSFIFDFAKVELVNHMKVFNDLLRFPVEENAKIAYGPDYNVVSSVANDSLILKTYTKDFLSLDHQCTDGKPFVCPHLQKKPEDYQVVPYEHTFVVLIDAPSSKLLYVFTREDKKWKNVTPFHSFQKEAIVKFDNNLVVIAELAKLQIFDYRSESWKSQMIDVGATYVAVHGRNIVIYHDQSLSIISYNPKLGSWHKKQLQISSDAPQLNNDWINRFDFTDEDSKNVNAFFKSQSLQIFENLLLISQVVQKDSKLTLQTRILSLNASRDVISEQIITHNLVNLNELTYNLESDGTTFHLYIKQLLDQRIVVRAKSFSGKLMDEIIKEHGGPSFYEHQRAEAQILNGLNHNNENFRKMIKQVLGSMIPWWKFNVQLGMQGISIGNETIIRNTGIDWKLDKVSIGKAVELNDQFSIVSSDDKKTIKLNRYNTTVKEIKLRDPSLITYQYPKYIAYQSPNQSFSVQSFKSLTEIGEEHTFVNEEIQIPLCNIENVVSLKNVTDDGSKKEMIVRPFSILQEPQYQDFVSKVTVIAGNSTSRVTSYDRKSSIDQLDKKVIQTITVTPGNDKQRFGWREMTQIFDIRSRKSSITYRWFNGTGVEVQTKSEDESKRNEKDEPDPKKDYVIYDKTEKLIITDCAPLKLEDEMCAFYGFEVYETGVIGSAKNLNKWKFNNSNIVRDGHSLTGRSFLQLEAGQTALEGVFHPKDQTLVYIASTWLRPNTPMTPNTPTNYLQAKIGTSTITHIISLDAEVKYKSSDWYYVEVRIDFNILRDVYHNYVEYYKLPDTINDPQFIVTLKLDAASEKVAFDHIRFSPVTHDFQANVFDPDSGKNIEIIQNNGLISRTIYDHFGEKQIASIQQNGNVLQFTSATHTGVIPGRQGLVEQRSAEVSITPETGFLEVFDVDAFQYRCKIQDVNSWKASKQQLVHTGNDQNKIWPRKDVFDEGSVAIRFYYMLEDVDSNITLKWDEATIALTRKNDVMILNSQTFEKINDLPISGELLIFVEGIHAWIWINGVLLVDQPFSETNVSWKNFSINVSKHVLIEDLFVLNKPQVTVEYKNAFGDTEQSIHYVNSTSAIVTETLYDELGRESIVTKATKITRKKNLLRLHDDFITNKDAASATSVWKTGVMTGEVSACNPDDHGYPYHRLEYASDPLNQKEVIGRPGKEFNTRGNFNQRESHDPHDIDLLRVLFPKEKGFTYHAKYEPNGSADISVKDANSDIVAKYIQTASYDHLLSTYDYDENQNLIKILPPMYHDVVETASTGIEYKFGDAHLTPDEKKLQQSYGTYFHYNNQGQLIQKAGPDIGIIDFLYNSIGDLRFMRTTKSGENATETTYFTYNNNHLVERTGQLLANPNLDELRQYLDTEYLPCDYKDFQTINYAKDHPDPLLRNNIKTFVTHFDDVAIMERMVMDDQDKLVNHTVIIGNLSKQFTSVQNRYVNDRVKVISYPVAKNEEPFELIHTYDRSGNLINVGTKDEPKKYGEFEYNSDGLVITELIDNKVSHLKYNSPGFLMEINDQFLSEKMTYTTNGYGQSGFGDTIVMSATYEPKWIDNVDQRWFQVSEQDILGNFSRDCFRELQDEGYINSQQRPERVYNRATQVELPLECAGKTSVSIAEMLARKSIPKIYGHRYSYGSHQELVKAKYFRDETVKLTKPLQPNTFHENLPEILSQQDSKKIWKLLTDAEFIISIQQRYDPETAIGTRGTSYFIRFNEIIDELKQNDQIEYIEAIQRLLYLTLSEGKILSVDSFIDIFLKWENTHKTSPIPTIQVAKEKGEALWKLLSTKGFLPTNETIDNLNYLNPTFKTLLQTYSSHIPRIVQILSTHFIYELGEHPFDLQSYDIDANGNHRRFYSGFNEIELTFQPGKNQVDQIHVGDESFSVKYDTRGNVINAEHKNIEMIEYHPLSQRMTSVRLKDGRVLKFLYNAQGGRVLKRVFSPGGDLITEVYYVRDDKNRVLVDRETKYMIDGVRKETATKYIYGPRGLFGFIRNAEFYNIFLDHVGSVRLVIKNSQVIAAYDYLPYGELMREFGTDPDGYCRYRFTGQEWDEETGLYSFHARIYDPMIGRFLQPDPKAQYFSLYKYAGNSPISFVDPDGQFALLLATIIFAIGGAYLGGAGANRSWNPLNWDYKSGKTWAGMVFGGVAGALLPVSFTASVQLIGLKKTIFLGLTGSYLMNSSEQGINFFKWDWAGLQTYNLIFQGFSAAVGIPGGVQSINQAAAKISSRLWSRAFLFASYSTVAVIAYGGAAVANDMQLAFWKWDWRHSKTYSALFIDFSVGVSIPAAGKSILKGIYKTFKSPKQLLASIRQSMSSRQAIKNILKNPKHPLYKTIGSLFVSYLMGSAASANFNPLQWNFANFATYEQVLLGLTLGKQTEILLSLAKVRSKYLLVKNRKSLLKYPKQWLDNVQLARYKLLKSESVRLLEESFSPNDVNFWIRTSQQRGHSPSVIRRIRDFFGKGRASWRSGETTVPTELEDLVHQRAQQDLVDLSLSLQEFQDLTERIIKRNRQINLDEPIEFLTCLNRRRRRMIGAVSCTIKQFFTPTRQLLSGPTVFLSNHALVDLKNMNHTDGFILKPYDFGYALEGSRPGTSDVIKARYLNGSEIYTDMPLRVENSERMILANNQKASNIYGRFDNVKEGEKVVRYLDLYQYKRPELEYIFINGQKDLGYSLQRLVPSKAHFVTKRGEDVNELKNVTVLYHKDGHKYVKVPSKDGVIVIDRPLYHKMNETFIELSSINDRKMSEILDKNWKEISNQKYLYDTNTIVIPWEDFSNLPGNYELLMNLKRIQPLNAAAIIYRDPNTTWQFISQKLNYASSLDGVIQLKPNTPIVKHLESSAKPDFPYHLPSEYQKPVDAANRGRRSIPNFQEFTKPYMIEKAQVTSEDATMNMTNVDSYTETHFHGLMHLVNLVVLKLTGEKFFGGCDEVSSHGSSEIFLKATEIVDIFEDQLLEQLSEQGLDLEVSDITYRLYERLGDVLRKCGKNKIKDVITDAFIEVHARICDVYGSDTASEFQMACNKRFLM